jgi:mRNA interferase MazF
MALTSVEPRAGFPLTIELQHTALPKRTWAKVSQVRTLSTQRLSSRITACHPLELQKVVEGLNEIVGRP